MWQEEEPPDSDLASASRLHCSYSFDLGQVASSAPETTIPRRVSYKGWERQ